MLITWTPPLKSGKYKVRCRVSGREFDVEDIAYSLKSGWHTSFRVLGWYTREKE